MPTEPPRSQHPGGDKEAKPPSEQATAIEKARAEGAVAFAIMLTSPPQPNQATLALELNGTWAIRNSSQTDDSRECRLFPQQRVYATPNQAIRHGLERGSCGVMGPHPLLLRLPPSARLASQSHFLPHLSSTSVSRGAKTTARRR